MVPIQCTKSTPSSKHWTCSQVVHKELLSGDPCSQIRGPQCQRRCRWELPGVFMPFGPENLTSAGRIREMLHAINPYGGYWLNIETSLRIKQTHGNLTCFPGAAIRQELLNTK